MKTILILVSLISCMYATAQSPGRNSHGPDCSGQWPTQMAYVQLKNAGLIDNKAIDLSKTKTIRLSSELIGKNRWRQIYQVTFTKLSGEKIDALAIHDASNEECSMTGVEVFVVSKHLNPERK